MNNNIVIRGIAGLLITFTTFVNAEKNHNYEICFNDVEITDQHELIDFIEKLIEIAEEQEIEEEQLIKAQCNYKLKRYDQALKAINSYVDINKSSPFIHRSPFVHHFKSKVLWKLGKRDEALRLLEYSVEINSFFSDNYVLLATYFVESKLFVNAEKVLLAGLELSKLESPEIKLINDDSSRTRILYAEVPIYLALSDLYLMLKRPDKAGSILKDGITRSNGSLEIFEALISIMESQEDTDSIKKIKSKRCQNPSLAKSRFC